MQKPFLPQILSAFFLLVFFSFKCFSQTPSVSLTLFSGGYAQPVDIANCGDERLFIVSRYGTIQICDSNGVQKPLPFLNITNKVKSTDTEQGLLGMCFSPGYLTDGYFYVYYINLAGNTTISRFKVKSNNPDRADSLSETIIKTIVQPYSNHNGGQIRFGADGLLYCGLGDGGSSGDPGNRAQNKKDLLGKMIRINVSTLPYTIPSNNPFVNDTAYAPEIWALGLRNPWRWSFDRLTNDIWIGDVGQNAYEEIDFQQANTGGLNYGWRCYEGLHTYNTAGCTGTYVLPVHEYAQSATNGCAVTGGYVYRGALFADLFGKYLFSDYCSGQLRMIEKSGSTFTTTFLTNFPDYQHSCFGEDRYGELYVAYLSSGQIYKMTTTDCQPVALIKGDTAKYLCSNASLVLEALQGNGLTYQWRLNGSNITGATNYKYTATQTGSYRVLVTKPGGCTALSPTVTVGQGSLPSATITASNSTVLCNTSTCTLNANAGVGLTYQWKKGSNLILGADGASFIANAEATYRCIVTNNFGCSKLSNSKVITRTPVATITAGGPTTFCNGDSVSLQANSGTGLSYQWIKGTNNISGATKPAYNVKLGGKYKARVTDSNGCYKLSNVIQVAVNCKLSEGDAISDLILFPNPANQNTVLNFTGLPNHNYEVEVFNSLGLKLSSNRFYTEQSNEINYEIDLSNFPAGVLLVRISDNNFSLVRKLVKQ